MHCSNFTAFPSTATNDYLAAELRETLNTTEAIQPAAQLEAQLGRSYLEQALFPQGVTSLCTFLETHLPNSQVCLMAVHDSLAVHGLINCLQTQAKQLQLNCCCLFHSAASKSGANSNTQCQQFLFVLSSTIALQHLVMPLVYLL